jgi:magnesium transporter
MLMSDAAADLPAPDSATLFHGVSFNPADNSVRPFGQDELERELGDPAVFSWIDLQAPEISALNEVLRRWDIDLVLSSHFNTPEVLPRIVERSECLAFYLYEIENPGVHLDTSRGLMSIEFARMILVLGGDFVITYHRAPLDAVEEVKSTCADSFRLAGKTPGFIAFLFLQRCLYDYAHLNLANDNALDKMQAKVRAGDHEGLAEQIAVASANVITLKKLAASVHIVLMILATKVSPFISAAARASFLEMQQSALAVRAAVDSSRNLLDGLVAALQAAAAHRTSEIARVLTVMSGVLLPLSLIAGIYGMNFHNMPELRWRWAYYAILGLMAVLGGGLYLVFRRLGWVGSRGGK